MKTLGGKAYGSIPHMPGSKRGPGDHGISEQHAQVITGAPRRGMYPDPATNPAVALFPGAVRALRELGVIRG